LLLATQPPKAAVSTQRIKVFILGLCKKRSNRV
jgi:hypothetical protein